MNIVGDVRFAPIEFMTAAKMATEILWARIRIYVCQKGRFCSVFDAPKFGVTVFGKVAPGIEVVV